MTANPEIVIPEGTYKIRTYLHDRGTRRRPWAADICAPDGEIDFVYSRSEDRFFRTRAEAIAAAAHLIVTTADTARRRAESEKTIGFRP